MLHSRGVNWAKLNDSVKNGSWRNMNGEIFHDILPNFESVNSFIENAL